MLTILKTDVAVSFGSYRTEGTILHDPERQILVMSDPMEPDEVISKRLDAYGYFPAEDGTTVFITDWSENEGLAASLVAAGVIEIVRELIVGPFKSRAYEVRVLPMGAAAAVAAPVAELAAV
ncbi:hypothetical protein [Cryobacterium zhongshanensis]|uniref:Uncharacterized protein n=1 Tax=Cryobacterium zhongshanensis TaxID=2928153 RepID=A0AA41R2S2_9MICO|nr:hypothetical protein [Cryobacterium zhongshanensis]MCI4659761.1 hypothetical protein [Cryobacterium zhongshanensis]